MIIVARHGRTESNASGLLLGRADPVLDPVGRDQASRLGRALGPDAEVVLHRIVASPLRRTTETAASVALATGLEVEIDERLIELDYGEWDQRPLGEVSSAQWAAWRADVDFAPPGGESLAALGERVRSLLADVAEEARDHNVLLVTHVSPIKAAVAWALGAGDELAWRMFVAPASITRIAVAATPSLHAFNDCAHLNDWAHLNDGARPEDGARLAP